jgi:hypothetical protein
VSETESRLPINVEGVRVEEGEDSVFLAVLERAAISTRNLH